MFFNISIATLLALALMLLFVPFGRKMAIKLNLMDKPNSTRKFHDSEIPVIGGISIFFCFIIAVIPFYSFFSSSMDQLIMVLSISSILLFTGVIDDKSNISPLLKLFVQFVCAILFLQSGLFESVYIFGASQSFILWIQKIVIAFLVVGLINAFNFIDGIDGLAAGLFFIVFLWLGLFSFLSQQYIVLFSSLSIAGTLVGFLYYNLGKVNKIFLGDGGTLFLSSFFIGSFFLLSNDLTYPIQDSFFLLGFLSLIMLPVLDAFVVSKNRIVNGSSPFKADRTHLHHRLLQLGLLSRKVLILIISSIIGITIITLLISVYCSFLFSFLFMVLLYLFLYFMISTAEKMKSHQRILLRIENRITAF